MSLTAVFLAFFAGVLSSSFFLGRFLATFFFSLAVTCAEDELACRISCACP